MFSSIFAVFNCFVMAIKQVKEWSNRRSAAHALFCFFLFLCATSLYFLILEIFWMRRCRGSFSKSCFEVFQDLRHWTKNQLECKVNKLPGNTWNLLCNMRGFIILVHTNSFFRFFCKCAKSFNVFDNIFASMKLAATETLWTVRRRLVEYFQEVFSRTHIAGKYVDRMETAP